MEQIAFDGAKSRGAGYGAGDGDGDGYGAGDESANVAYYAAIASQYAGKGGVLAIWRSTENGKPANGGSLSKTVEVGDIHETQGPLSLCNAGTLHATFNPDKWKGARWWVVSMHGEISIGDDKLGSLKREIIAELK